MMHLLLIGTGAVCGLMFVLWLLHFPLRNAAIVDAGWAAGLAMLAIVYAVLGDGWGPRRAVLIPVVSAWGFRLAFYLLFTRVLGHPEEGRYVQLRREWGAHIGWKFLVFFESQALLNVLLSTPFLLIALRPEAGFGILERVAFGLWAIGIWGEIASDAQLTSFKRNPANKGKTCRKGLWNYSRHPNYFFEWLIWMAYALAALPARHGYIAFLSPALILYFVLRVTGIPATEAQALRTKGDDYRDYQRTTSAFIPWFHKA